MRFGVSWPFLAIFTKRFPRGLAHCALLYYIFSGEKHKSSEIFTLTTLPFSLQVKWGRGLPPAMHFNKVELPGLSWRSGLVKMKYGSRLLCCKVEKESDFGLEMRGSANGNIGGSMSSSSRTSNLAASLLTLWDFSSMTMHW